MPICKNYLSVCYFNPRSHEGSDFRYYRDQLETTISIHAPTRGATEVGGVLPDHCHISIHAPTRGATNIIQNIIAISNNFNPRSHEGSDCIGMDLWHVFHISIHAPTRGATVRGLLHLGILIFQSTLPRGERPETAAVLRWAIFISIHAPTRGATSALSCITHTG